MRKQYKKILRALVACLCIAVIAELLCFNYECYISLPDKSESVSFTISDDIYSPDGETFTSPEFDIYENGEMPYFLIDNINKSVKYLYLDIYPSYEGAPNEACFDVFIKDEGNSGFYNCGTIRLHPSFEKTKYIRLHSYGRINAIKLVVNHDGYMGLNTKIRINDIKLNANVPIFFSVLRVFLIAALLFVIYMFRPNSVLYKRSALNAGKKMRLVRFGFMAANIIALALLLSNNTTFANPSDDTYRQYNLLAEAICQGRVNIDVSHGELMNQVTNPYDLFERRALLLKNGISGEREPWWDIAYFGGKFYVYFGIVPELLFFLPAFALTKTHLPTSVAVFIVCALIVVSAYVFIDNLVRVYFKNVSFGVSLFACVMLANCCGVLMFIMLPTIYYIVILTAILFVLLGLMQWIKARELIINSESTKKAGALIASGSLCMALVAGCRPQFLAASFLIIPLFGDIVIKNKRLILKGNISKLVCVAVPYIFVAAGIMYYNYIRFNSPFDFGASYNLTTNNMPLRGFNLARLVDGAFMYFLQPPVITQRFPFILETRFNTNYVGITIIESMYGGVIFTSCFTAFLFMLGKVKKELKEKRLWCFVIMTLLLTVIIAAADTELSAILVRYTGDFLYLMMLSSIIVMFALFEKYGNNKKLIVAMLTLGLITLVFAFFMSFNKTTFLPGATEGYFNIYNMFI